MGERQKRLARIVEETWLARWIEANAGFRLDPAEARLDALEAWDKRTLWERITQQRIAVAIAEAVLDDVQAFVGAHAFDTTVGRRIDDYLTERLKSLSSELSER
jgi:uncharacterized coiled-coil protein SlyX